MIVICKIYLSVFSKEKINKTKKIYTIKRNYISEIKKKLNIKKNKAINRKKEKSNKEESDIIKRKKNREKNKSKYLFLWWMETFEKLYFILYGCNCICYRR